MATSARRRKQQAEKKARKKSQMSQPGGNSVYARKLRGIFPPNSPYTTGQWATREIES